MLRASLTDISGFPLQCFSDGEEMDHRAGEPSGSIDEPLGLDGREAFGELLRAFRKAKGIRQLDLGLLVHMDHSAISRLESSQAAPKQPDVDRLADALALPDKQRARLLAAYERDVLRRSRLGSDILLRSEESIQLARSGVAEVCQLRRAGTPQLAAAVAARSAAWIRLMARRTSNDRAQAILLATLVDMLAEQTKSYLDYLLPDQTWPLVARPIDEQRRIGEYLHDPRLLQLWKMNREGALYLAGRYHEAHTLSREFLEAGALDPAWQPELLRAAAINAGYVDDNDGLQQATEQVDQLLDTGSLDDMDAAFLLEGLARGQAAMRQPTALTTIERAWTAVGNGQRHGEFSSLRSVQLIRTQLKATQALGIPATVQEERLGASGLAACTASGYTRHHHEISALLESTAR